jgi:hypothetical protein
LFQVGFTTECNAYPEIPQKNFDGKAPRKAPNDFRDISFYAIIFPPEPIPIIVPTQP